MATNLVKTKAEEDLWEKAKAQVKKDFPEIADGSERFYALAMHLYQNMKKGSGKVIKSLGVVTVSSGIGGIKEYLAKSRGEATHPDANDAMGGPEEIKSRVTGKVSGQIKQVLDGSWTVRFASPKLRTKQRSGFGSKTDAMSYAETIIGSFDAAMGGDRASRAAQSK